MSAAESPANSAVNVGTSPRCACGFDSETGARMDVICPVHDDGQLGRGDTASCGHPNPIWSTDSQLWNEVMNGGDRDEEAGGILCPSCFADRAHDYFDGSRWRILGWRMVPDWGRP